MHTTDSASDDIEERLRHIASESLRVEATSLTSDTRFGDLGADSLDLIELGMSIEEAFQIEIAQEDYGRFLTMRDAVEFVRSRVSGTGAGAVGGGSSSPSRLPTTAATTTAITTPAIGTSTVRSVGLGGNGKARIVVTGVGALSPVGLSARATFAALLRGESGISSYLGALPEGSPVRIAGQVRDFDPERVLGAREARRHGRFTLLALAAAQEALAEARLLGAYAPDDIATVVGVGMGGVEVYDEGTHTLREEGPTRVSPFGIPGLVPNMAGAVIARHADARGPSFAVASACASSGHAIGQALRLLQHGEARAVITGGSESALTPLALAAFARLGALSRRNETPSQASRPFDRARDGFVLAEGAAMLVLETLEGAEARGAAILAELVGYGASNDAFQDTQPDPEGRGAQLAMRRALKDANLSAAEIDYINAHATGTPIGDRVEAHAIHAVFGAHAVGMPVSSTKSMTGHLLGGAGALEAVICVLALGASRLPPTINVDALDPECGLDVVPNLARNANIRCALSNSFGFGGQNASLIFKREREGSATH